MDNNTQAFLALVRAGLWEKEVKLLPYGNVDFKEIYRLAEEQSVVGLVAAGLEHVADVKVAKDISLVFAGNVLQIEQRNKSMNYFIGELIDKMRNADIYTILVKGQGVAQCYERPMWRTSGDVDLLCSQDNFLKAQQFLLQLSSFSKPLERYSRHLGMSIDSWSVEVHGSLRTGLAAKVDSEIDVVQNDVFYNGNVRSWDNGKTQVFLPSPNNDVFFVFTHFLMHFYRERMNIRQICDWCRLMWKYSNSINADFLYKHINKSGLIKEWETFSALAVNYLGMQADKIPYYNTKQSSKKRLEYLAEFILNGYSGSIIKDTYHIAKIFPKKTIEFSPSIFLNVNWLKIKERIKGL